MLNFAQGEMATLSAYVTLLLLLVGMSFWVALLVTVALSAIGGALIERGLVRRLESAGELPLLTLSVALLLGLNALMSIIWSTDPRTFPSPFGSGLVEFGGLRMTLQQLGSLGHPRRRHGGDGAAVQPDQRRPATARRGAESRLRHPARPATGPLADDRVGDRGGRGSFAAVVAAPVLTLLAGHDDLPPAARAGCRHARRAVQPGRGGRRRRARRHRQQPRRAATCPACKATSPSSHRSCSPPWSSRSGRQACSARPGRCGYEYAPPLRRPRSAGPSRWSSAWSSRSSSPTSTCSTSPACSPSRWRSPG